MALGWVLFGAGCTTREQRAQTTRNVLDVVSMICPPEITVGDCMHRVEAFLALGDPAIVDAGAE